MILVLAFVTQVIAVVGLVGYLSFRNGQRAVSTLATQLRQELTTRIQQELRGYFETPHEINRLNAAAMQQGELDIINAQYGETQLYQQMKIAPTVAFVYCGSTNQGEFFGVLRSPDTGQLQLSYSNRNNSFLRDYYRLDVNGDRTHWIRQAERTYDSRQRPWFQAAITEQKPTWTDIYIAFTTGLPNITASFPVYDKPGRELLGVCATDVVLPEEFRGFLNNLDIGISGQAFVVNRNGDLISNSTDEPLMVQEGGLGQVRSLHATESKDKLVRGTSNYLVKRFGGFENILDAQQLEFQLDGKRQFLEVLPFRDEFGLDWLIVVVVPESDFMAEITASTRNTFVLCGLALIVAIAIAVVTAQRIAQPILRVSKATEEIARGNFSQQVTSSSIAETRTLAESFNSMTRQLTDSFEALRQSEAKNRAIVAAIPDLLMRVSRDGIYLDVVGRDRLVGIHGEAAFIPGSSVYDSLPHPLADRRISHIQQALDHHTLQVYEQRIRVNHRWQEEEVRVVVLHEDEVLIMVRDITNRKKAEEALRIAEENYRSIYENALEGIFQASPAGQFLSVNPAMAKIYGYVSPEEMRSQITDIGHQIYVDVGDRLRFMELMDRQGQVTDFEYQSYRRDGSVFWVQEQARTVRDDAGHILYYEGLIQDITERKEQEAALRRHLEELQVEVDEQRRKQEVARITQSSYFQEVQEEISRVNIDEFWNS